MITIFLAIAFLVILIFMVFSFRYFARLYFMPYSYIASYFLDLKIDVIFTRSVIIAYLHTEDLQKNFEIKKNYFYERAISIVTDVMLGNGINPRDYQLQALVRYYAHELGLPY